MRPLISRSAVVTATLALAGAVAVSAPLGHSIVAQSNAVQPIGKTGVALHSRPVGSPTATPSAQSAAVVTLAQSPTTRVSTAPPRVAVGTGQWGLINQDRAAAGLPPLGWNACLAAIAPKTPPEWPLRGSSHIPTDQRWTL